MLRETSARLTAREFRESEHGAASSGARRSPLLHAEAVQVHAVRGARVGRWFQSALQSIVLVSEMPYIVTIRCGSP